MSKSGHISLYYILIFGVILIWGFDPLVYKIFYKSFSASAVAVIATFSCFVFFTCISFKKLKNINKEVLKLALPIGLLNSVAGIMQRSGLQYTSPANYSFLENLAVAVVPIVIFIVTAKKPSFPQIVSVVVCLLGCFILSGMSIDGFKGNIGDILCSSAGIIYGISIALIGINAKKIDSSLYMVVFTFVYFLVSLSSLFLLHNVKIGGKSIETARFVLDFKIIILIAVVGLISVGIAWLMRTVAIKKLDPTFVAVISPFTAVVAGILSILNKSDVLTPRFVIGGTLIVAAAILFGVLDARNKKNGETI